MWKNSLSHSIGTLCLLFVVSCDKLESIVEDVVGDGEPTERREGISRMHDATASDVKLWLLEPNVLVVLNFHSESNSASEALNAKLGEIATRYAENSAIMKVNVGKPGEAATMAMNDYQIDQTPVLKFFLNGKEVAELRGDISDEKLESVFSKHTGGIKGEFTMREGDLPGTNTQRTAEDMMVRGKKGDLPAGITRVRVPKEAKEVTEGLPKSMLKPDSAADSAAAPSADKPAKKN